MFVIVIISAFWPDDINTLSVPTVPNPIQLTRFCNVSDMSDRILI